MVDLVILRDHHAVLALTWKAADHEDLETIIGPPVIEHAWLERSGAQIPDP